MQCKFKKLTIHHFLSFDNATIDLTDRGYCQVIGVNKNSRDCAKSNGAGKSTIFNAISFALTGETLQGLKSNLANINFNDGCYVELEFEVNNHKYRLLRSKDDKTYGTDLKIYIDDEDKSGKGIRESNALLSQYLPDLTSELIGSTILIGQGMPTKFTSNSPSGRKEVLEHLSQSDFMIQDLKNRITRRLTELANETRIVEDDILKLTTQNNVYNTQLDESLVEFKDKYANTPDFDTKLDEALKKKEDLEKQINSYKKVIQDTNVTLEEQNKKLLEVTRVKSELSTKYSNEHALATNEFNSCKIVITNKIYSLEQEITKVKNIKDVCPMCGQKLPNVVKQDTSKQEEELISLKNDLANLNKEIEEDNKAYLEVLDKINSKYDATIKELTSSIQEKRDVIHNSTNLVEFLQPELTRRVNVVTTIENEKKFFEENKQKLLDAINSLNEKITTIKKDQELEEKKKLSLDDHTDVVSKMNTIIKRDFRGFLLKNIIEYIDSKAKEYASQIFGCNDILFELDGNDINISFCGKDYENLSGGEKQRVDLIIQFALRSFLVNYLQFSSNILVLDEITDALDSESCDKVMNFITNELKDIESVFIISHHEELELPVDSRIIIEKNELGVSNVIHQE